MPPTTVHRMPFVIEIGEELGLSAVVGPMIDSWIYDVDQRPPRSPFLLRPDGIPSHRHG